jgi:hypothetical protein
VPLRCPDCESGSLKITGRLELPPDGRDDEITLQIVECAGCGLAAIAVYRESRRGALDSECVDHDGCRVSAEDLRIVREAIDACPSPNNSGCDCETHRWLGGSTADRWDGLSLAGIAVAGTFIIDYRP